MAQPIEIRRQSYSRTPEKNSEYMRAYYQANKDGWNKRTPEQRAKYNATRRERYASDPELRRQLREWNREYAKSGRKRNTRIKREFGITAEEYAAQLEKQGGGCAICNRRGADRRLHRLHIDHCHQTGAVRGLLCSGCNIGIGKFRDDPDLLARAALYVASAGKVVDLV